MKTRVILEEIDELYTRRNYVANQSKPSIDVISEYERRTKQIENLDERINKLLMALDEQTTELLKELINHE